MDPFKIFPDRSPGHPLAVTGQTAVKSFVHVHGPLRILEPLTFALEPDSDPTPFTLEKCPLEEEASAPSSGCSRLKY